MAHPFHDNARTARMARSVSPYARGESGNSSDHERHFPAPNSPPAQKSRRLKYCPWPGCGWSNLQKSNLDYHISRTHLKYRETVTCPDCSATLSSKSSYDRHARHKERDQHGSVIRCPGQPPIRRQEKSKASYTHSSLHRTDEKYLTSTTPPHPSHPPSFPSSGSARHLNNASSPESSSIVRSPIVRAEVSERSLPLRQAANPTAHAAVDPFAQHRVPHTRSTPSSSLFLRGPGIPGGSSETFVGSVPPTPSPRFATDIAERAYDSDPTTLTAISGHREISIDSSPSWSNSSSDRSATFSPLLMRADGQGDTQPRSIIGRSKFYDPVRDVERYPDY